MESIGSEEMVRWLKCCVHRFGNKCAGGNNVNAEQGRMEGWGVGRSTQWQDRGIKWALQELGTRAAVLHWGLDRGTASYPCWNLSALS